MVLPFVHQFIFLLAELQRRKLLHKAFCGSTHILGPFPLPELEAVSLLMPESEALSLFMLRSTRPSHNQATSHGSCPTPNRHAGTQRRAIKQRTQNISPFLFLSHTRFLYMNIRIISNLTCLTHSTTNPPSPIAKLGQSVLPHKRIHRACAIHTKSP